MTQFKRHLCVSLSFRGRISILAPTLALLFCPIFVARPLHAQTPAWQAGTGSIYVNPATTRAGIGTTDPVDLLDLFGTPSAHGARRSLLRIIDNSSMAAGVGAGILLGGAVNTGGTATGFANIQATKENAIENDYSGALGLVTRTSDGTFIERLRISSTGYVGIGTTSPLQRLHVADRVLMISGSIPGLVLSDNQTNGRNWALFSGSPTSGHFKIRDNSAAVDRFIIDTNGNVGIGTSTPQFKLAVNGTIGTKEVTVTNTGWADYVFRPDYRLKPLSEVRAHIKEHGRLPEIPSETEVRDRGISLGEMQVKLLAKIEELTLHMIQAEERSNRLEEQNQDLRKQNFEIQGRIARLESWLE